MSYSEVLRREVASAFLRSPPPVMLLGFNTLDIHLKAQNPFAFIFKWCPLER